MVGIYVASDLIEQTDGSYRRMIRRGSFLHDTLVGFYDPHDAKLEVALVHAKYLLDVVRVIGVVFGAESATRAFRNLLWICPSV